MESDFRRWMRLVEASVQGASPFKGVDLFLHHNGPAGLPNGRPTGPAYFGTEEFSDQNGYNFGPMRYRYWAPPSLKILNLNDQSVARDEFLRDFCTEYDQSSEDCAHLMKMGAEHADNFDAIYDAFSNSMSILPLMTKHGLDGLRFQDEFLLTNSAIKKLIKLRGGRGEPEPYPTGNGL